MFIDGMRYDDSLVPNRAFFLKMDGPFYTKVGRGNWDVSVHISAESKTPKSDTEALYKFRQFMGELVKLFTNIDIYRVGESEEDDSTYVDCLLLDNEDRLEVLYAGQRGVNLQNPHMASIDMKYKVRMKG